MTAKMKSVCAWNPRFSSTGEPEERPIPVTPPEATAASDWRRCQPTPNGSDSGRRNAVMRLRWNPFKTKIHSSGAAATPAAAMPSKCFNFAPAT